jgi:hypothetical protein
MGRGETREHTHAATDSTSIVFNYLAAPCAGPENTLHHSPVAELSVRTAAVHHGSNYENI